MKNVPRKCGSEKSYYPSLIPQDPPLSDKNATDSKCRPTPGTETESQFSSSPLSSLSSHPQAEKICDSSSHTLKNETFFLWETKGLFHLRPPRWIFLSSLDFSSSGLRSVNSPRENKAQGPKGTFPLLTRWRENRAEKRERERGKTCG